MGCHVTPSQHFCSSVLCQKSFWIKLKCHFELKTKFKWQIQNEIFSFTSHSLSLKKSWGSLSGMKFEIFPNSNIFKQKHFFGKSFYSLSTKLQKFKIPINFTQSITQQSIKQSYILIIITFQNLEFWDVTHRFLNHQLNVDITQLYLTSLVTF